MSKFLDDLKEAADNGKFNSDAAKKINEINELADIKASSIKNKEDFETLKEKIINVSDKSPVTEEKAFELNTEYEKKMEIFKKQDMVNAQLATLIEIEDMVKLSVGDMFSFVEELEDKFEKEEKMFGDLHLKIEEIKSKYKSIN